MLLKRTILASGVVLAALAAAAAFYDRTPAVQNARYTDAALRDHLAAAVTVEPVQPSAEVTARVEEVVAVGEPGVRETSTYAASEMPWPSRHIVLKDSMPYVRHAYQKETGRYVVHPMQIGGFLRANAKGTEVANITNAILARASELPNGGLAWYYPRYFTVARMLGSRLKYSAIAQGAMVGGLVAAAANDPTISHDLAAKAMLALEWPFAQGGANLDDVALLEMPAFGGAPEIILNGWIDALLHLRTYVTTTGDERARAMLRRNLEFLVKILPEFDAPDAGLSRYSDLSPYTAEVELAAAADIASLRVLYVPKVPELKPVMVPLRPVEAGVEHSIYDNAIIKTSGDTATISLACSQHYDTVLLSNSAEMDVDMRAGELNRLGTIPDGRGPRVRFASAPVEGGSYVALGPEDGLICGYPTNFAKSEKNSYHVYHVVSLMVLALGSDVTDSERQTMLTWGLKWYDDMQPLRDKEGLDFQDPQKTLNSINSDERQVPYTDFAALLAAARQMHSAGG